MLEIIPMIFATHVIVEWFVFDPRFFHVVQIIGRRRGGAFGRIATNVSRYGGPPEEMAFNFIVVLTLLQPFLNHFNERFHFLFQLIIWYIMCATIEYEHGREVLIDGFLDVLQCIISSVDHRRRTTITYWLLYVGIQFEWLVLISLSCRYIVQLYEWTILFPR